jgi:predicted nucleotide-binding protein
MSKGSIFVSYARPDAERVLPIVQAVDEEFKRRAIDASLWVDVEELKPGERWASVITEALDGAVGALIFVSRTAMKSDLVTTEFLAAARRRDSLIIPIILERVDDMPPALAIRQWIDLSEDRSEAAVRDAASKIADATQSRLGVPDVQRPILSKDVPELAASIAQNVRAVQQTVPHTRGRPDSVFLVHGHDVDALSEMEDYLNSLGVRPVVLSRLGTAQSLFQKFLTSAAEAQFAVVILSADDVGASCIQYDADGIGDRALQFRARQNVILELGFFYGQLGWENVFVLERPPAKVFPNFERPSDILGAVFDSMGPTGAWRESLSRKLTDAGFRLKLSP